MQQPHICDWHILSLHLLYPLLALEFWVSEIPRRLRAGTAELTRNIFARLLRHYWTGYWRMQACHQFIEERETGCWFYSRLRDILREAFLFYTHLDIKHLRRIEQRTRWRCSHGMPRQNCKLPMELYFRWEDKISTDELNSTKNGNCGFHSYAMLSFILQFLKSAGWYIPDKYVLADLAYFDKVILNCYKRARKLTLDVTRKGLLYQVHIEGNNRINFPRTGSFVGDFGAWRVESLLEEVYRESFGEVGPEVHPRGAGEILSIPPITGMAESVGGPGLPGPVSSVPAGGF